MQKINTFLNVMMGSFFGVFIGSTISNYREYRALPEIYAARSGPWYAYGALQALALFGAVTLVCVIIKVIIKHRQNTK
ncbi:MAG: hypothetical protein IKQ10_09445 [Oscillospiraceae bacterium]|nr:hypothetical protein [Oscillospiraceae bacterium]